jgi:hypothetical protein
VIISLLCGSTPRHLPDLSALTRTLLTILDSISSERRRWLAEASSVDAVVY